MLIFSINTHKKKKFSSDLINSNQNLIYPDTDYLRQKIEQNRKEFILISRNKYIEHRLKLKILFNKIIQEEFFGIIHYLLHIVVTKYNLLKHKVNSKEFKYFQKSIEDAIEPDKRKYFRNFFEGNCFIEFWDEFIVLSDCSSESFLHMESHSNLTNYLQYLKSCYKKMKIILLKQLDVFQNK